MACAILTVLLPSGKHIIAPVQELVADGDTSSLYYTARGLMRLQSLYGTIPNIKGKGSHALTVKNLMTIMRKEMGAKAPRTGRLGVLPAAGRLSWGQGHTRMAKAQVYRFAAQVGALHVAICLDGCSGNQVDKQTLKL